MVNWIAMLTSSSPHFLVLPLSTSTSLTFILLWLLCTRYLNPGP